MLTLEMYHHRGTPEKDVPSWSWKDPPRYRYEWRPVKDGSKFAGCCGSSFNDPKTPIRGITVKEGEFPVALPDDGVSVDVVQTKNGPLTIAVLTEWPDGRPSGDDDDDRDYDEDEDD